MAAACLAFSFAPVASGQTLDPKRLTPQGYVSDFARILDPEARAQLERYCGTVEQSTGAQMAIVTVNSLGGTPIEDYANDLFRTWGIGKKGKDEGILLLLAVRDRQNRIEVGYGLEPILPDGFAGSVLREMRPSLREQNYSQALLAGAAAIGERIAQAKGVTLDRTLPRRAPPEETDGGFPLWAIVAVVVLLLVIGRRGGGGFLTGMVLGQVLGRSRYRGGGWGGGGFGGYDGGGGGGFGGFGGGDSGGGGASGSW